DGEPFALDEPALEQVVGDVVDEVLRARLDDQLAVVDEDVDLGDRNALPFVLPVETQPHPAMIAHQGRSAASSASRSRPAIAATRVRSLPNTTWYGSDGTCARWWRASGESHETMSSLR